MARYGYDLDGTLASIPELAHQARAQMRAGHKVYVITANNGSEEELDAKLTALNLGKVHKLIQVEGTTPSAIGQEKGQVCNQHNISVYYDNDPKVLAGVAITSSVVRCLAMPS